MQMETEQLWIYMRQHLQNYLGGDGCEKLVNRLGIYYAIMVNISRCRDSTRDGLFFWFEVRWMFGVEALEDGTDDARDREFTPNLELLFWKLAMPSLAGCTCAGSKNLSLNLYKLIGQ